MRLSIQGPPPTPARGPSPHTPSGIGTLSSERILHTSRGRSQLCGKPEQATQGPGHLAPTTPPPPLPRGPSAKYWSSRGPPLKTSGPTPPLVQMGKQCLLELTAPTGRSWDQPLLIRGAQNHGPLLVIPMAGPATEAELPCVCGEMQGPLKAAPGPCGYHPFTDTQSS